jgi:hypothetical protein
MDMSVRGDSATLGHHSLGSPTFVVDREFGFIALFCAIGLFVSLYLMLRLPADEVAALLAQAS